MIKGFDCAQPVNDRLLSLAQSAGYQAVGRYFGTSGSGKLLRPAEAKLISDRGFWLFTYFERTAGRVLLGAGAGSEDANMALDQASEIGQPEGSSIIFAVDFDFDPSRSQDQRALLDYFAAISDIFGARYKVGIYGDAEAILAVMKAGYATVDVLAGAAGWDRSRTYRNSGAWKARQYPESAVGTAGNDLGIAYDRVDITAPEALGCWTLSETKAPVPSTMPTPEQVVAKAIELQTMMRQMGEYQGAIDGQIGTKSSAAEMRIYARTRA